MHLTDPTNLFLFLISGTTTSQICKYIHIHMQIYDICYIINGGVCVFLFLSLVYLRLATNPLCN